MASNRMSRARFERGFGPRIPRLPRLGNRHLPRLGNRRASLSLAFHSFFSWIIWGWSLGGS